MTSMFDHILTINNLSYPQSLYNIDAPPEKLFVAGDLECLSKPCIAIVGTRKPTIFAQQLTARWAQALSEAGIVIVSGLALGIDAAAHRGALLGAAKTIAVLGCGHQHDYPKQHAELRKSIIAEGGCVISEYPAETPPRAQNFPRRNRIISGLSDGVLVIEAAMRSGSLVTAKLAVEQGKEVMAVPGSLHNPMARGCHWLIREGATLVSSVEEVAECLKSNLSFFNPLSTDILPQREQDSTSFKQKEKTFLQIKNTLIDVLSEQESKILSLIHEYPTPIDEIVANSRLAFHEVCSILVRLEISDHIQKVAGGYVRTV